jgi:hypothetical protein
VKCDLQNNEEGNQNSDKRKTYIHARQQYRHIPTMLFSDRDELLFCPGVHDVGWKNLWHESGNGVEVKQGDDAAATAAVTSAISQGIPISSPAVQAAYVDKLLKIWETQGVRSACSIAVIWIISWFCCVHV